MMEFTGKVMTPQQAIETALELQAGEKGGWKYEAEIEGMNGRVLVYDQDGKLLGVL